MIVYVSTYGQEPIEYDLTYYDSPEELRGDMEFTESLVTIVDYDDTFGIEIEKYDSLETLFVIKEGLDELLKVYTEGEIEALVDAGRVTRFDLLNRNLELGAVVYSGETKADALYSFMENEGEEWQVGNSILSVLGSETIFDRIGERFNTGWNGLIGYWIIVP